MPSVATVRLFAAGLLAAAVAACTTQGQQTATAGGGRGQCFLPSQVSGYHPVNDQTVDVLVGANDVYSLDLAGPCPNVDWSMQIGIRATAGASWVCSGLDAELLVPDPSGMGTNRCMVTNIRQLSPAEAKAVRSGRSG